MSPVRKKWGHPKVSWTRWTLIIFIVVLHVASIITQSTSVVQGHRQAKRNSDGLSQLQLDNFEQLVEDGGGDSSEFTIISPLAVERPHVGNVAKHHKRVVRRRRKKGPSNTNTTPIPTVITSVTLLPSGEYRDPVTSLPTYEAAPRRRYKKKHHAHKVPEVWRVQNFNLHGGAPHDLKTSNLGKRESSEHAHKNNYTSLLTNSDETTTPTTRDLNYDESINNHPFFNSSVPISNELQNSLQFTLQFLHPLLNSDTDLSENGYKHPENKTVALTHSLSDSVAQTPVATDLGFLPTHLKKIHPLLNQDSFISGDAGTGASKTGIRTNNDVQPIKHNATTTTSTTPLSVPTEPTLDTAIFSTTQATSQDSSETTTSEPTTTAPSTTTRTTTRWTPSTRRVTSLMTTTKKTTSTSQPTTRITTTIPTTKATTQITTTPTVKTTTTIPSSTSRTTTTRRTTELTTTTTLTPKTTTKPIEEVIPIDIDHILGILNITEVNTGSSSETPNISTGGKDREQLNEALQHPPIIMFPLEEKVSTTTKPERMSTLPSSTSVVQPPNNGGETTSAEVSSAEQSFMKQLLGIGSGSGSQSHETAGTGGIANSQSSDSGEQLLQLFGSLLEGQLQNQGKPSTNQQNGHLGLGSSTGSSNSANANDAQTNALLQSLILSSLKSQHPNQPDFANLFNLESLLTPPPSTTVKSQPNKPTPTKLKPETGLSDADLKSIFELLDNQQSKPPPRPTPTTTTTTTTPRPTTTQPPPPTSTFTTTLHPALQSMLDLFNNQLKPFQSIPSSAPTFLQTLTRPTAATIPLPTTSKPPPPSLATTTLNSIDLLSQLLNLGGGGLNKVNPVRSTPSPPEFSLASIFGNAGAGPLGVSQFQKPPQNPEFSLASIFGGSNNNIFQSPPQPKAPLPPSPPPPSQEPSAPSESNQLLNFFGVPPTTPPPPSGLYYWLDMNAFLGGDPKADGMAGIRPKIGNRYPFIKVH